MDPVVTVLRCAGVSQTAKPWAPRSQGMHKGAAALLWGEPTHDACQRFLLAAQRADGVGGTCPAPACPRRGKRERGRSNSSLPQANLPRSPNRLRAYRLSAASMRSPQSIWK